ncbi:hypothetical protein J5X94_13815, partial [Psychrobacter sp. K31L]|nr:hypothetical protein [Psychrobacter sp. K31L]
IQSVLHDLSAALQSSALNTQPAKQIVGEQARQFAQIIEQIVNQLEQYFENGSQTMVQQVIYNLREVQQSLRKAVGYTVFTNIHQLKTELESYMQTAAAQIEKLVYFAQQAPQGNYYVAIKSVLAVFLNGLQHIQMQIQSVAQYSQYGMKYGYASGLAQYGKGYGYAGQYRPYGYGIAAEYDSEYEYYPYGQKYGQAAKYDQLDSEYGYAGQYRPYKYGFAD